MNNQLKSIVKFVLILALFFIGNIAFATTYYIDAVSGNDNNDGRSPSSAWRSLQKVEKVSFGWGDNILFKRGQTFKGSIRFRISGGDGLPITFGAYGEGEKPILSCVEDHRLTWVQSGNNIWKATNITVGMQRLVRNGEELLQAHSMDELGKQVPATISWFKSGSTLYLYSTTDPNGDIFTYSECSQVILTVDVNNLVFQDLAFEGGNTAALNHISGSNITFKNLDLGKMSYMGIQFESKGKPSENIIVDGCYVDAHWTLNYFNGGIGFATWRGTREGVFFNGNFNHAVIKNSVFKNWHHSGINIWANPTNPNYINQMKIINNYITSPDIPYGGKLSFAGNVQDSEIAYNTFEDMYGGRMQMDGNNNHVHHNLFKNLYNAKIKYGEGGGIRLGNWNRENYGHIIEYNLFKNCYSSAIDVGGTNHPNKGVHDIIFRNNIFEADIHSNLFDSYIYIRTGTTTSNLTFVNNNFVASSNDQIIKRGGTPYTLSAFNEAIFDDGSSASGNYSAPNYNITVGYNGALNLSTTPTLPASEQVSPPPAKKGPFIMDKSGLY